jgi:hypothetical protein
VIDARKTLQKYRELLKISLKKPGFFAFLNCQHCLDRNLVAAELDCNVEQALPREVRSNAGCADMEADNDLRNFFITRFYE